MIANSPPLADTRICRGPCSRELPLDCFRLNSKGSDRREYWCNDCHKQAENERCHRKRRKVIERFAKSAHFQKLDRRLRAFTIRALSKLGGVERLAEDWVNAIRATQQRDPGNPFLCASFASIMRLIEFCESRKERMPADGDIYRMNDEQIHAVMEQEVLKLVRSRPEVAVAAAQALGWTVIPREA